MKTCLPKTGRRASCSGFTLIELLIVITIIAVLAGMAFPVTNRVMLQARKAECNQQISNLITAIKGYQMEYGHVPLTAAGEDAIIVTDSTEANVHFMECLMGIDNDTYKNPREIQFYEPKYTDGNRGGWNDTAKELYDPWGGFYTITLDTNFDKVIANPETDATPTDLRKDILIYSPGPDKDEDVWRDNIMSWK